MENNNGDETLPTTPASEDNKNRQWKLRLYVAGQTPRSLTALANLKKIAEEYLQGKYTIEVVDLLVNPQMARGDQITAIPTLIRKLPEPRKKIIGDLSNTERVLAGLDLIDEINAELQGLRARPEEAEETLNAIRQGEVDALVVSTGTGDQIYTWKSAERPYRIMIEQMTEGALTLSLDGIILFCNQHFALMVKQPLEKLIADSIYTHIAPEDKSNFDRMIEQNGQGEISLLAADKTRVPTHIALSTLCLDEDTRVRCVVVTDLTKHKLSEVELAGYREHLEDLVRQRTAELEKANLTLSREVAERKRVEKILERRSKDLEAVNSELEAFSYSVSHDLRAPLRAVDGFSEELLLAYSDKLDDQGRDYLRRIRQASQNMSRLINDLLKLSRVTRADMHSDVVEISEMVRSIMEESRSAQPDRRVEIIIHPGLTAKADRQLLEIALRNLIDNAWKFTGKCLQARIEFGMCIQDGRPVFFISDNGVGFDMKYADKLFQPFRRLHHERDFPGTGIGLATVQRILRRHGGDIRVESERDKGTIFYFTLGEES